MKTGLSAVVLAACIAAAGCGGGGIDQDDYDVKSDETGIRLKFSDGTEKLTNLDITMLDRWYKQIEECTHLTARPGPLVIVVKAVEGPVEWDLDPGTQRKFLAVTHLDDHGTIEVASGYAVVWWVLKHEFIHYVLRQHGLSDKRNKEHRSEFFGYCEYLS